MTMIPLGGESPRGPGRSRSGRSGRSRLRYEEVIDRVEQLIVERDLGPGDKLPSHDQLAQLAGVSLITVRRALEELERDGRVRRHQGLGTFLAGAKIVSDPSHTGGLGNALGGVRESSTVGTRLLGITRCLPSADLVAALQISEHDQVWRVHRQRLISGKPLIVETATIPVRLAPDLDHIYEGGSLYETLATQYGLDDDYEEQFLDVIHPESGLRALLHLNPRAFVVRIRGITRDATGVPFDAFEQVYPASQFAFVIAGKTNRRLHQGDIDRDWSVAPVAPVAPLAPTSNEFAPAGRTTGRAAKKRPSHRSRGGG
ncbi:MAG: GntR family transcriptional regulator [Nocardioidaceae bacterium]